jgi:hypothetical protein
MAYGDIAFADLCVQGLKFLEFIGHGLVGHDFVHCYAPTCARALCRSLPMPFGNEPSMTFGRSHVLFDLD